MEVEEIKRGKSIFCSLMVRWFKEVGSPEYLIEVRIPCVNQRVYYKARSINGKLNAEANSADIKVDFYFPKKKIVINIGLFDEHKEERLRFGGYKVFRFNEGEILKEMDVKRRLTNIFNPIRINGRIKKKQ